MRLTLFVLTTCVALGAAPRIVQAQHDTVVLSSADAQPGERSVVALTVPSALFPPQDTTPSPIVRAEPALDERAVLIDEIEASTTSAAAPFLPLPRFGGWIGIVKWISLGTSAGFGSLGFVLNREANEVFDRLVHRCESNPDLCRQRDPDGSYADEQLESLFQDVLERDGQAQASLIASQITFGLSVALFIVDWQRGGDPGNIPYDPETANSRLRLTAVPGEIALRYYVSP